MIGKQFFVFVYVSTTKSDDMEQERKELKINIF